MRRAVIFLWAQKIAAVFWRAIYLDAAAIA